MPKVPEIFRVVADTREQAPWFMLDADRYPAVETGTLRTGDYSVRGMEGQLCIERKSLADLYSTATWGRERFERELARMAGMRWACIVVEADWPGLWRKEGIRSNATPQSIVGSLLAWQVRYGVHVQCPGPRKIAEAWAWRALQTVARTLHKEAAGGGPDPADADPPTDLVHDGGTD